MAKVKSLAKISAKWQNVTPQRQQDYIDGVNDPRTPWAASTLAAEKNYETGVQKGITNKSFGKGVSAAGDAKWKKGATEKGPARWAQGVQLGGDNYSKGFAPFQQALANITLPPRGAKGDPSNIQRVAAVAKAMHDTKLNLTK